MIIENICGIIVLKIEQRNDASMTNYKKMYFTLFNAVTTAIDQLQNAQRKGEDTYIQSMSMPPVTMPKLEEKKSESDE